LRKTISTLVVACALVVGVAGVAQAAQPQVKPTRCGTKYRPACTAPKITNKPLSPTCVAAGAGYKLPTITFVSNTGIDRIQVSVAPKTIKLITFKGQGVTQYSLKGLTVPTTGLAAGGHELTVTVTDLLNKTASKTLRFSVCQAKPVFTG
jgi:hypothetical protein